MDTHAAGWALLGMIYPLLSSERGDPHGALQAMLAIYFDSLSL